MKCLSIRQPWALLVCVGAKSIENRSWTTSHRGEIAFHAGSYRDAVKHYVQQDNWVESLGECVAFGAIIGTAELYNVVAYDEMYCSDSGATGPYCLLFQNPKLFRQPIPHKGRVNLCDLPPEIAQQVKDSSGDIIDLAA